MIFIPVSLLGMICAVYYFACRFRPLPGRCRFPGTVASHYCCLWKGLFPYPPFAFYRRPLASSCKYAALLLTAAASLTLAGSASAQEFKVTATGTITSVFVQTIGFDSSVAVGTPFTFTYLFDYSTPGVSGSYAATGASFGATATFGNYTFAPSSTSIAEITLQNNLNGQNYDTLYLVSDQQTTTGFGVPVYGVSSGVQVTDQTGFLLSSDALPPLSTYSVAEADAPTFFASVSDANGYNNQVSGNVTFLSAELVNPVPEASTVVSLGMLGLGGLVLAVRRRRTAR